MKQKLLEMIQVTVWLHTDHFFWFGFTKTKTGAKTAPKRHNLVPKLHSYRASGAGVAYDI